MPERDKRASMSIRAWGGTRRTLEELGRAEKFAHTTLIGQTAEILAGAIHCSRCGKTAPVVMGDCTGKPLREWVDIAIRAVYAQRCRTGHTPVLVGAEAAQEAQDRSGTAGEAATTEEDVRERTEPPAPVPAPDRKAPRQRKAAPVLVGASNGQPATSVPFRAGPGVDCLHENFRGVKGVCPDCKQWVGGKR